MRPKSKPVRGAALPPALEGDIAVALTPIAPAAARSAVMRRQVLQRARDDERFMTVRKRDGQWIALAADIGMKVLHDDGAMRSFLLRLDAGACLPAHDHAGDEHSVVLEGDCMLGDVELGAGDYHFARAGTRHGDVRSRGGCVLFIRQATPAAPQG